jgi:hypothetical protein
VKQPVTEIADIRFMKVDQSFDFQKLNEPSEASIIVNKGSVFDAVSSSESKSE